MVYINEFANCPMLIPYLVSLSASQDFILSNSHNVNMKFKFSSFNFNKFITSNINKKKISCLIWTVSDNNLSFDQTTILWDNKFQGIKTYRLGSNRIFQAHRQYRQKCICDIN